MGEIHLLNTYKPPDTPVCGWENCLNMRTWRRWKKWRQESEYDTEFTRSTTRNNQNRMETRGAYELRQDVAGENSELNFLSLWLREHQAEESFETTRRYQWYDKISLRYSWKCRIEFLHTKSETPDLVSKECDLFPYTPQSSHLLIFEKSFCYSTIFCRSKRSYSHF